MAYWGVADGHPRQHAWSGRRRGRKRRRPGKRSRRRARRAKTQRERDWIEALSAYYRDYDKVAVDARLLAYNSAMERMTQRYPDDYEARAFYALTLQASAPKSDTTYANQLKSAAMLEKLFEQNPQHPGVSHYLIHAYDYPPLADKGIAAARRYAGIAPAVPHARHMPSHIYSMVGLWEEVDRFERVGARNPARLLSRVGFHGLCAPAARAGCQGQRHDRQGTQDAGSRRPPGDLRQFHGAGRHAGTLRARTRRLGRRRRATGDRDPISAGGFADTVSRAVSAWHAAAISPAQKPRSMP